MTFLLSAILTLAEAFAPLPGGQIPNKPTVVDCSRTCQVATPTGVLHIRAARVTVWVTAR